MAQARLGVKRLSTLWANLTDHGAPMDVTLLNRLLEEHGLPRLRPEEYRAEKLPGKNLYRITWIAESRRMAVNNFLATDDTDRGSLARQNRSHHVGAPDALLIARRNYDAPFVICIRDREVIGPIPAAAPVCVIIENMMNFVRTNESFCFLKNDCGCDIGDEADVYFASGAAITNTLFTEVLGRYKHMVLFLDVDLGGVKIAKTLIAKYPHATIHFALPRDIKDRLARVVKPPRHHDLEEFKALSAGIKELDALRAAVSATNRFIEQEAFL